MTKMFAGASIMMLADEGKVSLDDPAPSRGTLPSSRLRPLRKPRHRQRRLPLQSRLTASEVTLSAGIVVFRRSRVSGAKLCSACHRV